MESSARRLDGREGTPPGLLAGDSARPTQLARSRIIGAPPSLISVNAFPVSCASLDDWISELAWGERHGRRPALPSRSRSGVTLASLCSYDNPRPRSSGPRLHHSSAKIAGIPVVVIKFLDRGPTFQSLAASRCCGIGWAASLDECRRLRSADTTLVRPELP